MNTPSLTIISEPRLQRKLELLTGVQGITLRKPPPAIEHKGFTPDIGAYRFPEWFIVQRQFETPKKHRARRLVNLRDLDKGRYPDDDGKRYPVVPVRFVRACPRGHVGDIDWHAFVHGADHSCRRELQIEERGTSGDLDAIWIVCACGATRVMSQAARMELRALGSCNGSRPWLGPGTREACGQPNRLLIRSASNAYFPQLLSVISIPDSAEAVDRAVAGLWDTYLSAMQNDTELQVALRMPAIKQQLEMFSSEQVQAAIKRFREGARVDTRPVKEAEFDALIEAKPEIGGEAPDSEFLITLLSQDRWNASWTKAISKVVLVHRLREVVAQVGFTRFESAGPDIQGELDIDVKTAPLGTDVPWLPAIENRGEGLFIQFSADAVTTWMSRDQVKSRDSVLQQGFRFWAKEHESSSRQYPGSAYYMLHTLSHLLITAISLECGYPASSLRERIYATPGRYGVLIYTGSPDAEGTLGGLVEEGRRIRNHLKRTLELGILCSNDPVCAFHAPRQHDHQPLLGSACHGCLLISETSCEQRNDFLDRALIVQTIEYVGAEFFENHHD